MSDIIAALRHDHVQILAQLDALIANDVDVDDRAETFADIAAEIRVHAGFEELEVYPLIVADRPVGDGIRERVQDDHQEIAGLIEEIAGMDVTDEAWFERLQEFQIAVRRHCAFEERSLFPALRKRLAAAALEQLGRRYEDEKPGVV